MLTVVLLVCFRGLRLLLVSRQAGQGPSADAQRLILLLDMGNFQKAELEVTHNHGPDLQNILRQCYDYLTIMPKLQSNLQRSYVGRKAFPRHSSLAIS